MYVCIFKHVYRPYTHVSSIPYTICTKMAMQKKHKNTYTQQDEMIVNMCTYTVPTALLQVWSLPVLSHWLLSVWIHPPPQSEAGLSP